MYHDIPNADEETAETAKSYKCPCCGAALEFDGTAQKMTCAYCGSEIETEVFAALAEDEAESEADKNAARSWDKYGKDKPQWEEADGQELLTCPSCGGEIFCAEGTEAATHCPYCDSPALVRSRLSGAYKPDLILPFRVSKEDAVAALGRFTKRKVLLPGEFRTQSKTESITGMYVPFWLFDCDTNSRMAYRATRKRTWRVGDTIYTRTSYYRLLRRGTLSFADIPVDASVKLDNTLIESIEPYDLHDAVPFSDAYLAGFTANCYDDTAEHCSDRARERVNVSVNEAFRRTTEGYLTVTKEEEDVMFTRSEVKYALLPVWFLNMHYKGKTYPFAINGQTGKLTGSLPVSAGRFAALFAAVAVPVAGILAALLFLL